MSTHRPTTDRTASDQSPPTLTDGRWRATPPTPATTSPTRHAQRQFAPDCETRLYNLVDAENRVSLD
jgi:hypothetical protein